MKTTLRDHSQIPVYEHLEELSAKRVYVVNPSGPSEITVKTDIIEVPVIIKEKEEKTFNTEYVPKIIAFCLIGQFMIQLIHLFIK